MVAQRVEVGVGHAGRFARVNADAQEQVGMLARQRVRARHDLGRVRDLDEVGDATMVRAIEDLLAVAVEALVAEMAVGVDHGQVSSMAWA